VVGVSQLTNIGVLHGIFDLSPELSTSCGMMLWLVTFMSVLPAGLLLARREHVSLTRLEKTIEQEEQEREQSAKLPDDPAISSQPSEDHPGQDRWVN